MVCCAKMVKRLVKVIREPGGERMGGPGSLNWASRGAKGAKDIAEFIIYIPSTAYVRSGMLEAGVDRIICQVVDPKLNHIFRPQIERAIHEFLAAKKKEAVPAPPPEPESQDPAAPAQDAS
ncbi:hypothetical protein CB1_000672013 [Camelus ferus]|nr:hypothetical protein CB1_000672013 [Camelus ferus]